MIIQRRLMVVLAAKLRCVSHKLSMTILPPFLHFTKIGTTFESADCEAVDAQRRCRLAFQDTTLSTDTPGGNKI